MIQGSKVLLFPRRLERNDVSWQVCCTSCCTYYYYYYYSSCSVPCYCCNSKNALTVWKIWNEVMVLMAHYSSQCFSHQSEDPTQVWGLRSNLGRPYSRLRSPSKTSVPTVLSVWGNINNSTAIKRSPVFYLMDLVDATALSQPHE